MKKVLFVTLALIALGCKTVKVVEKSPAKSDYQVSINKTFEIELVSNPSTGYTWHWANEAKATKVRMVKSNYVSKSAPNLVGGGGVEQFTFKGVQKGTEIIELIYIRPWEKGAPPAKRVVYKVEVN